MNMTAKMCTAIIATFTDYRVMTIVTIGLSLRPIVAYYRAGVSFPGFLDFMEYNFLIGRLEIGEFGPVGNLGSERQV